MGYGVETIIPRTKASWLHGPDSMCVGMGCSLG